MGGAPRGGSGCFVLGVVQGLVYFDGRVALGVLLVLLDVVRHSVLRLLNRLLGVRTRLQLVGLLVVDVRTLVPVLVHRLAVLVLPVSLRQAAHCLLLQSQLLVRVVSRSLLEDLLVLH